MTSSIDTTKPATGVAASKSAQRANWTAAKTEIQFLQARPRLLTAQTITPPATLAAFNFTDIATSGWSLRRIEVEFVDLSPDSTQSLVLRIGPQSALETTDYEGTFQRDDGSRVNFANWFGLINSSVSTARWHGSAILTLLNPATNTWICKSDAGRGDTVGNAYGYGRKALAGDLSQISLFPASGLLANGTVNCMVWEVQ